MKPQIRDRRSEMTTRILSYFVLCFTALPKASHADSLDIYDLGEYLIAHSQTLKIHEHEHKKSSAQLKELRGELLPKIDFNVQTNYYDHSLEAKYSQLGDDFRAIIDDYLSDNDRQKSMGFDWNFTVEQPLYAVGRYPALKKMKQHYEAVSKQQYKFQKAQLNFSLASIYTSIIRLDEKNKTYKHEYNIYESQYKRSKELVALGRFSPNDLIHIEAKIAAIKIKLLEVSNNKDKSLRQLKQLISLPLEQSITIKWISFEKEIERILKQDSTKQSIEINLKTQDLKLNRQRINYLRSHYFPTFSLLGKIQNDYTSRHEKYFDDTDKVFDADLINYSIGIQMHWNLFNGFTHQAKLEKQSITSKIKKLELGRLQEESKNTIQHLRNNLQHSLQRLEAAKIGLQSSLKHLQAVQIQLNQGTGTLDKLLDAQKLVSDMEAVLIDIKLEQFQDLCQLKYYYGFNILEELI